MTLEFDAATAEARDAVTGHVATFIDNLMERVGGRASAHAVFGDPVERDGVTVIPVAKVRWMFGGGGGSGGEEDTYESGPGQGVGGGGAVSAAPLGYIEVRDGHATFHQVKDPAALWPLILAGAAGAWLVLRGLRALFR